MAAAADVGERVDAFEAASLGLTSNADFQLARVSFTDLTRSSTLLGCCVIADGMVRVEDVG